jgi:hypothetical protein
VPNWLGRQNGGHHWHMLLPAWGCHWLLRQCQRQRQHCFQLLWLRCSFVLQQR